MTATPVERNYRPALRAERKRQSAYHDSANNAEMYLTMKYGGDWWERLTQETADATSSTLNLPTLPTLTPEREAALTEIARARFEGYQGDPTLLDNAYDVVKGATRTGLSVLDAGVDWVRNMATSAALSGYNLGKNPSRHTFGEATRSAVLPITRWKDAAFNTTLWTQISRAIDGGFEQGFGAEGTGDGFYVNYDSPVGQQKNQRAYDYAHLDNGEAASLGRLTAESIGLDKNTAPYTVLSGLVDAVAIMTLDPLNAITGGASSGAKSVKVMQALQRAGVSPEDMPRVMELLNRGGTSVDHLDSADALNEVLRAKSRSRIVQEHPDLSTLRDQYHDEQFRSAAQKARRENDFVVDNREVIDDYRRLGGSVDQVVKDSGAATDEAVLRELEVGPKGATEQEARAAAERMGAEFDIEDAINDVPEGTFFHGTSQPVEGVSDAHYSPGNVYGQGLYVTDDRDIAQGYMKKKPLRIWPTKESEATDPRVYTVEEVEPVKFVDLDGPIPDSIMGMLRDGQAYSLTDEYDIILDLIDSGEIKTLADVFDHIRRNLYGTIDDKQEWFGSIRANLEVEGFGGYTHKGGRLTDGRPHNVRIYWFPESQVRLVPLEAPRAKLVKKPGFERVTDDAADSADEGAAPGGTLTLGDAAAPPPIRANAERLDVDPEEAAAAAERARNAAALEDDTVRAYFDATDELFDLFRAAGTNLDDVTPEDFVQMLRAWHGLSDKGVDLNRAMKGMVGGDFDNIAKLVARIDNPADLYDMFPLWGADTLRMLSKVTDPHEALMVMFNGVLKGDITRASNRVARWSVQYGQSGAAGSAFMRRAVRVARAGVPNSQMAHLDDADSMLKLTSDFITESASMAYRKTKDLGPWEQFRRDWLEQMIAAPDAVSRKRVWIDMQNDILHVIPGWDDLPENVQSTWKGSLKRYFDREGSQEARIADVRERMTRGIQSNIMGLADDATVFNEDFVGLINAGADLSEHVAMMDTRAMRKLFEIVQESGELSRKGQVLDKTELINDYFDLYLRPLYLAFRPAYMLLQVADSGGRALAMGFTNVFTSPLQTAAIAAHLTFTSDSKTLKALQKIVRSAPVNPDGTPMFGEAQVSALQGILDEMSHSTVGQYLLRHQFRDFATGSNIGDRHLIDLGWKVAKPDDSNFHSGWAQTVLFHMTPSKWGDDMFQDVLDVMLDEVPERIQTWADESGRVFDSRQDMVTDYYFSGPGQESFQRLIASAQMKRQHIPLLRSVATDRSRLHAFLWDGSEAASIYNRVHDLTGHFDPAVMRTFREAAHAKASWAKYLHTISPRKAEKAFKGKGKAFYREVTLPDGTVVRVNVAKTGSLENLLSSVVKRIPEDRQPLVVRFRGHAYDPERGGELREWYQEMLSGFFTRAGDFEKRVGQAPMLRDEVLLESAKRIAMLNRADAEVMYERIMAQLPKYKRTSKQREIVAMLKASRSGGTGIFTLEEVTKAAQNAAFRRLSDSMYGVRGRNAGAQRFAIMLPFIQSWVNASRVYLKQAALNPKRAANALRLLRTANTDESGVLYDITPGVNRNDDPSKPLFWVDDLGNRQVSIPLLGYPVHAVDSALSKMLGAPTNPNFQPFVNLRVDRWNPLNFGEPLPGVGPGVTIPASVIDRHVKTIPTELRKWWFVMETGDVTQDKNVLEANAPWFVKEFMPAEEDIASQMGNAVASLVANNPEKYLDENGYILEDKLPALERDAKALALALYRGNLWRAAVLRGGTSLPKTIKNTNGEVIGYAAIAAEFDAEVERTGSIGAGYAYLVDKYGPQGLAYLIGMRDPVPIGNDEGYQFASDNPEVFDETYDVLGYFFPSSDMSGDPVMRLRSKQYQRLLTESGQGLLGTPKDYAAEFNQKAKSVRDLRLEQRFINGELTKEQYEAEKAANGADYQIAVSTGYDTGHREKVHRQIDKALLNPTLRATPTGQALQAYLVQYDAARAQSEGGSLTGAGDAPLRAYLRQQGERLCEAFPEFIPIWRGQLMWEVDE